MACLQPEVGSPQSNDKTISARSSFLTTPHRPVDLHDVPYRPSPDDRTSLNMKKKHHRHLVPGSGLKSAFPRDPQGLECSGSDIYMLAGRNTSKSRGLPRCKSLEQLHQHSSGSISPTSVIVTTEAQENDSQPSLRQRRWTLPSKSEATRGYTPLKSTVKQATMLQDTESPAMITLRRATNNPTPRKSEITFFPEPTFSHEKNGLLSYLISTFSRAGTFNDSAPDPVPSRSYSSRSASVASNAAHGTVTVPAATVCTEITVDTSLTMPDALQDNSKGRRCSTKYTSGSTVYEVIWDENDSTSNGDSSSRPSVIDRRRSSMAVLKLEAQLARSQEPSRRQSQASNVHARQSSVKSVDMFPEQALTVSKLEAIFPRLLHKTGLRDLPRSRAKRQRRSTVCSIMVEEADPRTLPAGDLGEHKLSISDIDFFPPLTSRRNSGTAGVNASRRGWKTSDPAMELTETFKSNISPPHYGPLDSASITSNQKSRRSSNHVTATIGIFRQPFRRFSQPNDNNENSQDDDDDDERRPLLG